MKDKLFKAFEMLCESLYFLIITYTLSSMAASFNPDWFSLLFRVANVFALTQYYSSIRKHTGSTFWTFVLLTVNLAAFALLAWNFGYIRGEFTPFPRLY